LSIAACWVIGQQVWQQLPAGAPHRLLAAEIGRDLKAVTARMRRSDP
jgi:hypothetical protein